LVTAKDAPLKEFGVVRVAVTAPPVRPLLKFPSVQVVLMAPVTDAPLVYEVTEPSPFAEKYSPISSAPLLGTPTGLRRPLLYSEVTVPNAAWSIVESINAEVGALSVNPIDPNFPLEPASRVWYAAFS
jgi:hypothetical protein